MGGTARGWTLRFRSEEKERLEADGWLDPEAAMARRGGVCVKALVVDKRIDRFDARGGAVFLKRFLAIPLVEALRARVSDSAALSRAGREWRALRRLAELGIAAPRALVCGEWLQGGLARRAYLATAALPQGRTLERVLYDEFDGEHALDPLRLRALAVLVAEIVRRMHEGGVNHRDLYVGHLWLDDNGRLHVLDLDRADVRDHVPLRWRVKDLAALHFSTPQRLVPARERLRFLRDYLGEPLKHRRDLIAAIERKAAEMRARAERRVARGAPNVHVNE